VGHRIIITNIAYSSDFKLSTDYLKVHHKFNKELEGIIENSGYKDIFLNKYRKGLGFLDRLKTLCLEKKDLFEKLSGEENIYCMRLKGQKNIRILFSFVTIDKCDKAILLHVFDEKNKSDYTKAIKIAKSRVDEIIKAHYVKGRN